MSKNIIICGVLVFFALSMNVALSEMVYPQEMTEVSAPYPEATVTQTIKLPERLIVGMESNDNLDQILEFYKTELSANGWTIVGEAKQQEGCLLMGEKGSKSVDVSIVLNGQSGKSGIVISLYL